MQKQSLLQPRTQSSEQSRQLEDDLYKHETLFPKKGSENKP